VERDRWRLALDDQPRLGHQTRQLVADSLRGMDGLVAGLVDVERSQQPLRPSPAWHEPPLHPMVPDVRNATHAYPRGDVRRRSPRQDDHPNSLHPGEQPQRPPSERQD
jgi:hypothetical protein